MARGLAILLVLQFVGEGISAALGIPVPGNVIGMGLMVIALMAGIIRLEWVEEAAELLLSHMAIFFIPAGVGVMVYFDLIGKEWLPITVGTVLSTFAVMAVTGWVETRVEGRKGHSDD